MKNIGVKNVGMNRMWSTKWFTFYTKIRPWLVCVFALSSITDFMEYIKMYSISWWISLYYLVGITQAVLCIVVFVKSNGNYIELVDFIRGVLLFEIITMAYQQGVLQYIESGFQLSFAVITATVVLVISYFIWYRLNMKYFKNRIERPRTIDTDIIDI